MAHSIIKTFWTAPPREELQGERRPRSKVRNCANVHSDGDERIGVIKKISDKSNSL